MSQTSKTSLSTSSLDSTDEVHSYIYDNRNLNDHAVRPYNSSSGVETSDSSSKPLLNDLGSDVADGEILFLMRSLQEDESPTLTEEFESGLKNITEPSIEEVSSSASSSNQHTITPTVADIDSPYGHPLSQEDAMAAIPPDEEDGMIWNATIIPDKFVLENGKVVKGVNPRDIDIPNQAIKPRRPSLVVTQSDFFSSLTKVCEAGSTRPRFIFNGILNGWPSLRCFELLAIEYRRDVSIIPSPKEIISGQLQWVKAWKSPIEGVRGMNPQSCVDPSKTYRVQLRGASWTRYGWSKDSPGFVFWYESQCTRDSCEEPKVYYGTDLLDRISDKQSKCTNIHMISHRYAKERETPRDLITYHSICLLEWEHGKYCTVTEAAYLNGMGGYRGRSNWFEDRDVEPMCSLYKALPPEMICPWNTSYAEIRCYDVCATNFHEFKMFVKRHTGPTGRFLDPHYTFSHPARLTHRTKLDMAQYLINYIMRDSQYAELRRNCQTYSADLCSFIAGKKNIQPFHPVSRIDFQNRTYLFLYDHHLYNSNKRKKQSKPLPTDINKSDESASVEMKSFFAGLKHR